MSIIERCKHARIFLARMAYRSHNGRWCCTEWSKPSSTRVLSQNFVVRNGMTAATSNSHLEGAERQHAYQEWRKLDSGSPVSLHRSESAASVIPWKCCTSTGLSWSITSPSNNNSYCFVKDKKEITNSRMMFTQSEITNRLNLFHRQKVTWKKIFAKTVLYYCY